VFSYLNQQAFVKSVLEKGSIPFVVRGNFECDHNFTFVSFGIRISPPTLKLRLAGEDSSHNIYHVSVRELRDERFFPGEIELPDRTPRGIAMALSALETWADLMCIAVGNPKIVVEPQLPVETVIPVKSELRPELLERSETLVVSYLQLKGKEREKITKALWWYRKACATWYYSIFDSYAAYWNCLEILCDVSGGRTKKGANVDEAIRNYLVTIGAS
jgi:hypothetical protein